MCLCGVWLRPNQSTMNRIRAAFSALKTPYYRNTVILSRGRKRTQPRQMDHQKAMDARRGATKRHEDRWQNDETYRASEMAHGWSEMWVKYFDCISKIDISHEAPYRQRLRHENTLHMRGVDSKKQATRAPSLHRTLPNKVCRSFSV